MTTKRKKRVKQLGLKKEILKKVKSDTQLVAKIIEATKKSYPTVMRWLDENSELLTTAACLNVICSELRLLPEDVLFKAA